jgi:hypothetical protein
VSWLSDFMAMMRVYPKLAVFTKKKSSAGDLTVACRDGKSAM